jgi:hypothetical protein
MSLQLCVSACPSRTNARWGAMGARAQDSNCQRNVVAAFESRLRTMYGPTTHCEPELQGAIRVPVLGGERAFEPTVEEFLQAPPLG